MTDHEHLRAHHIDLIDDQGVTRLTLTAGESEVVIGGAAKERVAPFAGVIIRDEVGNERGGIGYLGGPGGRAVWGLDNPSYDAVGTVVGDDGAVTIAINQPPAASAGDADGVDGATRIVLQVGADGTPSISLADKQDRPRLRLTLRSDGAGAIEFLNAAGEVVHAIVPEHD